MNKLKINKRIIALLLSGSTVLTGLGMTLKSHPDKKTNDQEITITQSNTEGHTNINPIINFNVDENDFVVLDLGSHNRVNTHFEESKIKYCDEHDISLGAIISPATLTEAAIYDDVEYVKNIIRKYDIDFPIYLNLNNIIENDNLNSEMKTKLIKNFLDKCTSNNIYVGIYGTDTNLCRASKLFDTSKYDAFLVMDKEEIEYQGPFNVSQDLEGKIKSKQDLAEIVENNGLNTPERLYVDGIHTVAEGEDITDIALRYGMSVNDLLKYNDLRKRDIVAGCKIKVPTIVTTSAESVESKTYEDLEEPIRGCDISYYQEGNIDWEKAAENFDFMIIRSSQGLYEDDIYQESALTANTYGIPIGTYCYNDYTYDNCSDFEDFKEKQQKQADFTVGLLKNKKIDYPVYLDIEGNPSDNLPQEAIQAMLDIWIKTIKEAGYEPGLYCNQSDYDYIKSQYDRNPADELEIWIAGGEQYTGGQRSIEFETVVPSQSVKENYPEASVVQSTDSAVNSGIGNGDGYLDVDFSYKDYEQKEVTDSQQLPPKEKDFTRIDYKLYGELGGIAAMGGGAAIIAISSAKKPKKKSKKRAA